MWYIQLTLHQLHEDLCGKRYFKTSIPAHQRRHTHTHTQRHYKITLKGYPLPPPFVFFSPFVLNLTARTSEPLEIPNGAGLLVQWHWFKKATSDTGKSEQERNGVTESGVIFNALKHGCCLGPYLHVPRRTACVTGAYTPRVLLPLSCKQEESTVRHTSHR